MRVGYTKWLVAGQSLDGTHPQCSFEMAEPHGEVADVDACLIVKLRRVRIERLESIRWHRTAHQGQVLEVVACEELGEDHPVLQ